MRRADSFHDELCSVTEIGQETDVAAAGMKHETDWIISIVRHGEGLDADTADLEGRTGAEQTKIEIRSLELKFDCFLGEPIAINRDGHFVAERAETVGMVGMLVRQQNPGEGFRRAANLRETFADLLGAETGIDQEPRITCFEVGTISVGTAAENRELNRY